MESSARVDHPRRWGDSVREIARLTVNDVVYREIGRLRALGGPNTVDDLQQNCFRKFSRQVSVPWNPGYRKD
jgi:hypothetical protein